MATSSPEGLGRRPHPFPSIREGKREGKKQRERERGDKEREGREREWGSREEEGHRWSRASGGGRGVGPSRRWHYLVESRRGWQEQSREKKEEEGWRKREREHGAEDGEEGAGQRDGVRRRPRRFGTATAAAERRRQQARARRCSASGGAGWAAGLLRGDLGAESSRAAPDTSGAGLSSNLRPSSFPSLR